MARLNVIRKSWHLQSSDEKKASVQESPVHSYWLKEALLKLDQRDICDVMDELRILTEVYNTQAREMGLIK